MICWKCKREINIDKPARSDECPLCSADLHVCAACDFFEKGMHNDCRESSAEYIADKEKANFCDYFRVSKKSAGNASSSASAAAKNAFNALFGD